ncbi:MAG TPA: rhomboid family intramembrane serine protease, partial [Prolixibacteraceae bacterium]|nr:rhomboid family intramembrane serine protease [Prolixibacteraceae bacterium]
LFKPRRHVKVAFKQPPRDDHEYNRQRAAHQTEINRILDKISQSGYDSLTRDEKKTLFQQGKNH